MLYFHFHSLQCIFWFPSLTYVLFRSVLLSSQVLRDFLVIFLLGVSNLISLWSTSTLCMIPVLLFLLIFISWPRIWSVLVYAPRTCKKCILLLGELFYKCWLNHMTSFVEFLCILIFYVVLISVFEKGMLNSPAAVVDSYNSFQFLHYVFQSLVQITYFKSCLVYLPLWLLSFW